MNSIKEIVEDMLPNRPQQIGEYTATIKNIDGWFVWYLKSRWVDTSSEKQTINAGKKWRFENSCKNNLIKTLKNKYKWD